MQVYNNIGGLPNTFIGGVSATISTPALLAGRLINYPSGGAFSISNIKNFKIIGSDIECTIVAPYRIISYGMYFTSLTKYIDSDNMCKAFGTSTNPVFGSTPLLTELKLEGVISIDNCSQEFNNVPLKFYNFKSLTQINSTYCLYIPNGYDLYIPNCTIFGYTTGNDFVITSRVPRIIYCHPSLATCNSGSPDGDLAIAIAAGTIVRYVTNFTAPSAVTDLSSGTIYNTAIQLNFTPPSSTNAIDYYELYNNGVFVKNITASGQYITGLTPSTNYNITLIAVDVFYNKSVVSNSLSVSTNTTSAVPTTGLVSYYKLDSNSNDSYGSNNGTDTSVSYVSGKISNAGSYNGTTSKTVIGNPANLQLSTGSISCWIKTIGAGSSDRFLFGKPFAYAIYIRNGVVTVYSWGTPSGSKSTGININDGLWHNIVYVFESGTALNYVYVDGVLRLTTSMSVSAQSDPATIGDSNYNQPINALIDEASIYNTKLTQTQIDLLYNSGNGITL
jgi:hypothetical protein